MGATWDFMMADPQLRWFVSFHYSLSNRNPEPSAQRIGPEKGVIHIASGAVNNALWDMFARSRQKPLWKLVVDFSPVSFSSKRPFSPRKSLLELTNATSCS